MMYAIVWNQEGTRMIQVGIEPTRLLNVLEENGISNVSLSACTKAIGADGRRKIYL